MTTHDQITALAPTPEPFDPDWSRETLARIQAEPVNARRRLMGRAAALVVAGGLALTAGTAVAGDGPASVIKHAILAFNQPNRANPVFDRLDDPKQVARFKTANGLYVAWIARASDGQVCWADSDGTWDGVGVPRRKDLDFGCGGVIVKPTDPNQFTELTRPDQFGGFFKDSPDGPLIYGVSPYTKAITVRVQGRGVDRRLAVRTDSHGYGAALPNAARAPEVTLTFFDVDGRALGSKRLVAPVG